MGLDWTGSLNHLTHRAPQGGAKNVNAKGGGQKKAPFCSLLPRCSVKKENELHESKTEGGGGSQFYEFFSQKSQPASRSV